MSIQCRGRLVGVLVLALLVCLSIGVIRFALRSPGQSPPAVDERPAPARAFEPKSGDARVTPADLAAKARSAWISSGVSEADAAVLHGLLRDLVASLVANDRAAFSAIMESRGWARSARARALAEDYLEWVYPAGDAARLKGATDDQVLDYLWATPRLRSAEWWLLEPDALRAGSGDALDPADLRKGGPSTVTTFDPPGGMAAYFAKSPEAARQFVWVQFPVRFYHGGDFEVRITFVRRSPKDPWAPVRLDVRGRVAHIPLVMF